MESHALQGLRVLELGSGPATGMAGMILADFGAEVLRIENPCGDRLASLPASPMWGRGKFSQTIDLDEPGGLEQLQQLCAAADVFLCNWRPRALARRKLDAVSLRQAHPHLIYCHITGFGPQGPLTDLPGYEHAVAALAGRMMQFQGVAERSGPVFTAVQVGVHAASQSAVSGILAALLKRGDDGPGSLVETSLLQGMLPYEMGNMIGLQFPDAFAEMMPAIHIASEAPPPSLYYHPAQAGDGRWMQFGNLLPHLFDNFLIATGLVDVLADPAFDPTQMLLRPEENQEGFRQRMLEQIQSRPATEWMQAFIDDGGIVATTYQTTQEAMQDPDVIANGHVIQQEDGSSQLGPLARLTETPAVPGGNTRPGQTLVDTWLEQKRSNPEAAAPNSGQPLAGIRVVEIATIIAAPLGAGFLADMGADVIKVEQVGGDPFRGLLAGLGAARVNAGKRSISVNLKSEQGRQVVLDLLATADVLIHNYRPGVPERLGIGYDEVSKRNPRIVYLQCNGYGPDGPGVDRPSTHPVPGAAMGGVMYQMGNRLPADLLEFESLRRWCSRLMRANELNPDPNTALVVASSALLGLSARLRTGKGQRILVDMFGANAYANADDFLDYPGKQPRLMQDALLHGLGATYRLYPCRGDSWVFLALASNEERSAFLDTLTQAGLNPPSSSLLSDGGELTVTALAALFIEKPADEWQALLVPAGVACIRADAGVPADFWLQDEWARRNGFIKEATHPTLGHYLRPGSLVTFDRRAPALNGPPGAGQHNEMLLQEVGYDSQQVQELLDAGALWQG